ncbi:MAG: hypothetical protein KIS87_01365 [Phycisphaeraceae bacterium]|nr:hypothetical protein [Phycisphaeraceae bacterium]
MAKPLRVGIREGAGPLPGYLWSVYYLSVARDEAMAFLNGGQYAHVVDLVRALATEPDPSHPTTVTVEAIEDFYELKDKGGILGKINLRVYFTLNSKEKAIVILGAIKKEADGQAPAWVKIRIRNRLRKFRNGDFGRLV